MLQPYLKNEPRVIITDKSFPDDTTKKPVIALVDESDAVCKKNAYVFESRKLHGLIGLRRC